MANVLCLDFDETIVLDDTARQLFERFAGARWREFEAMHEAGKLSVEQYYAAALDLVEAAPEDVEDYVLRVAQPRDGFMELLDWAHWNGWQAIVVSNGFNIYVDPVLDRLGVTRMARHSGRARFDYRWRVTYFSPRGVEVLDGFMASYVTSLTNAGDEVVFVGGGAPGLSSARLASRVFAHGTLMERLKGVHPDVTQFDTFHDVVAGLVAR